MDLGYLNFFLECIGFAAEDRADALAAFHRLGDAGNAALDRAVGRFRDVDFDARLLDEDLRALEAETGIHRYTLWLLALIHCSQPVYERWPDKTLFRDTFSDLKYKVRECRTMYGICGTFVGSWYPIFFRDSIVKLGRLEFESCPYPGKEPVCLGSLTLHPGDPVLSIHIPSSGEPFDGPARLGAYRKAYDHFRCEDRGVPLVCYCESWLLYPPYTAALPQGSRIRDFAADFCRMVQLDEPRFWDAWRVYGPAGELSPENWPEDSGLQRMLKAHFMAGKSAGSGLGFLVFDGSSLLKGEKES